MTAWWIVVGLGIAGAVTAIVGWSQGRARQPDLGVVSHQWMAEHRLSHPPDSQR